MSPPPQNQISPAVERRPNFDLLRLFLALGVVLYHAPLLVKGMQAYTVWVNYVPGFLCVSGFLVLQSFENSPSWREFAAKRCWRLLPALCFNIAVITLGMGWEIGWSSIVQWLTGGHIELPPFSNGVLWSLGYEEWFYIFLALVYLNGGYRRTWLIWLLWVLGIAISAWSDGQSYFVSDRAHLVPAFFAGNLLYLYRKQLLATGPALPSTALVVALAIKHLWFPYAQTTFANVLMPPIFVWWAYAGWQIPLPRMWPDLSYGIYLWHMPAMWLLQVKGERLLPHQTSSLVLVAILAAAISWYCVEQPAKRFRFWLWQRRRTSLESR